MTVLGRKEEQYGRGRGFHREEAVCITLLNISVFGEGSELAIAVDTFFSFPFVEYIVLCKD